MQGMSSMLHCRWWRKTRETITSTYPSQSTTSDPWYRCDGSQTERGNKHVLVIQDFLTKWPWVFPIPDQKTSRIVEILVQEIILMCGVPEWLLSDWGTNLLSAACWDSNTKYHCIPPAVRQAHRTI